LSGKIGRIELALTTPVEILASSYEGDISWSLRGFLGYVPTTQIYHLVMVTMSTSSASTTAYKTYDLSFLSQGTIINFFSDTDGLFWGLVEVSSFGSVPMTSAMYQVVRF